MWYQNLDVMRAVPGFGARRSEGRKHREIEERDSRRKKGRTGEREDRKALQREGESGRKERRVRD